MRSSSSSFRVFRLVGVASFALSSITLATVVACNNDSEASAFATGGRGGTGGSTGTSAGGSGSVSDSGGTPPDAPEPPFVRCGVVLQQDNDAGDASTDASADADASSQSPSSSSNCESPPDDCIDSNWVARYSFGFCQNQTCNWDVSVIRCTKGCFRQVDGGDKCNE